MEAGSDLDIERYERIADGSGGLNSSGGSVEGSEESVSCRVELPAVETRKFATDDRVMALKKVTPR